MVFLRVRVLGFFIIYTHGLLNINANLICFADDTTVLIRDKTINLLFLKSNIIIKEIK